MNKNTLLQQIKNRRKQLGLKQSDMTMRIGMNRQQYGLIENQGNPTLENLNLIALGLNCRLVLVPADKMAPVMRILEDKKTEDTYDIESVLDSLIGDIADD